MLQGLLSWEKEADGHFLPEGNLLLFVLYQGTCLLANKRRAMILYSEARCLYLCT